MTRESVAAVQGPRVLVPEDLLDGGLAELYVLTCPDSARGRSVELRATARREVAVPAYSSLESLVRHCGFAGEPAGDVLLGLGGPKVALADRPGDLGRTLSAGGVPGADRAAAHCPVCVSEYRRVGPAART